MRPRADRLLRHGKARDRAAILPLIGAMFFLPPVAGVFRMKATVGGIPLIAVCLFGVWAMLVAGAAVLAPRLREDEAGETPPAGTLAGEPAGPDAGPDINPDAARDAARDGGWDAVWNDDRDRG